MLSGSRFFHSLLCLSLGCLTSWHFSWWLFMNRKNCWLPDKLPNSLLAGNCSDWLTQFCRIWTSFSIGKVSMSGITQLDFSCTPEGGLLKNTWRNSCQTFRFSGIIGLPPKMHNNWCTRLECVSSNDDTLIVGSVMRSLISWNSSSVVIVAVVVLLQRFEAIFFSLLISS